MIEKLGCPYSKFIFKRMREECIITNEPTHEAFKCDCAYDECEIYKTARKPIKPKAKKAASQLSIFEAAKAVQE